MTEPRHTEPRHTEPRHHATRPTTLRSTPVRPATVGRHAAFKDPASEHRGRRTGRLLATGAALALVAFGAAPALAATPTPATTSGGAARPAPVHAASGAARVRVAADTGLPAHATPLRASTAPRVIPLAIALNPRDPAGLARFDQLVSDPRSPDYRHFLSSAQYDARFAPSVAQVRQVEAVLRADGLRVTGVAGDRQVIDVAGSAAAVNATFGTSVGDYRMPDGQVYYAAARAATLPASVAPLVSYVAGLTDRPVASHAPLPTTPTSRVGRRARPAGDGPSGGESPADLRTAYDMGSVVSGDNGSGRSAGLVEFDGFNQSDINAFTQQFNLPAITPTVEAVDGGVSSLGSGQIEVTLDIDALAVYAPGASQLVYEAPNTDAAWTDEFAKIASDNKIDTLSTSWLLGESCESSPISATHNDISQMVSQGVTVLSASGDWGAYGCGYNGDNSTLTVDYPASDPNVTGVGGTSLSTGSGGSYQSEAVWNSGTTGSTRSGGGYSSIYPTPSYQSSVNSTKNRSVPDVAMAADPNAGGLSINLNGGWETVGGTSEASPLWAGYLTDAVQQSGKRLGAVNATLYSTAESSSYGADFHDITQGGNGYYNAGTGYDLCTGWGTPIGAALFSALSGGGSPPPTNDFAISDSPTSATVTAGSSTSTTVTTKVTSGTAETITLSASGLPTGASASFDPTSINGAGSSTLTIATSASTPAGNYTVTITGTDTDATHGTNFTLTVQGGGGGDDIVNGGFETGTLDGWTSSGAVSVVRTPVRSGDYAAQVGPGGTATLSQTFTAHHSTLSLYYDVVCAGGNPFGFTTITLTDDTSGAQQTLAQVFCLDAPAGYTLATGTLTSSDSYTISVENQDYSSGGATAATYLDDVSDAS